MTTMLRYLLALLVLVFGAAEAHAQVVTWEFRARVTFADARGCDSTLAAVTIGTPVQVVVTLDRNSPGVPWGYDPAHVMEYHLTAGSQYRTDVTVGSLTFTSVGATDVSGGSPTSFLFVQDDGIFSPTDGLQLSADLRNVSAGGWATVNVDYSSSVPTAVTGLGIPAAPYPLALTETAYISLFVRSGACSASYQALPIEAAGVVSTVDTCDALQALADRVATAGLPKGTANSLGAKLRAAEGALCDADLSNDAQAADELGAFQHELRAQSGKKVGTALADSLSRDAQAILDAITE